MSQQPYHPLGDLRCQLTYPHVHKTISDEEILHYLDLVNLSSLTTSCGELSGELNWTKVLSVSHRQALLHRHHEVLVILGDSGWRM